MVIIKVLETGEACMQRFINMGCEVDIGISGGSTLLQPTHLQAANAYAGKA